MPAWLPVTQPFLQSSNAERGSAAGNWREQIHGLFLFSQTFLSLLHLEGQKFPSKSLFLKPRWDGASEYRLWMCGSLVINKWGGD